MGELSHVPVITCLGGGLNPIGVLCAWEFGKGRTRVAPVMLRFRVSQGGAGAPPRLWTIIAPFAGEAGVATLEGLGAMMSGRSVAAGGNVGGLPFVGGVIGWIGYEYGRVIEPRAGGVKARAGGGWPVMRWARCDSAVLFEHATGMAWRVGESAALMGAIERAGRGEGALSGGDFALGALQSAMGEEAFVGAVARAVEYTRAGDIFQANVAHHLKGTFRGSARGLAGALFEVAQPWHGAYFEEVDEDGSCRIIASASPELFFEFDPASRLITTRPMKGTRVGEGAEVTLAQSEKDGAELSMIVDLMRNDIGRVSEPASVRVVDPRVIERHGVGGGGIVQATATITGRLRAGAGVIDALAATFPGGSVTGAPKVRAMQIIDELEGRARGPYCGAMGFVSDCGRAAFNIGIRTALIEGRVEGEGVDGPRIEKGTLTYPVGAGIVADSEPRAEWRETLDKARPILSLVNTA